MVNVMHVLPRLNSGGVEHSTVELAIALTNTEKAVHCYVASAGGKLVERLDEAGVRHFELSLATKNPFKIIANALCLRRLARQNHVDLFHVHSRAPAWSVLIASRLSGIPYISTYHGAYGSKNAVKRWYNSAMVRGCLVVTISDFITRIVQEQYGDLKPVTLKVSPGIDTQNTFNPGRYSSQAIATQKRLWGIPEMAPVILAIGRITPKKRFDMAIQTLAQLDQQNAYLVIAGSDQGRVQVTESLQRLATEIDVAERVIFVPDFCDIPLAYAVSDVVVFPTAYDETFGRIVVEAGAMAKPIVASHRGAIPEAIIDGQTGYLFTSDDLQGLVSRVRDVLAMPDSARQQLGQHARQFVVENYELSLMQEKMLTCYRQALATV